MTSIRPGPPAAPLPPSAVRGLYRFDSRPTRPGQGFSFSQVDTVAEADLVTAHLAPESDVGPYVAPVVDLSAPAVLSDSLVGPVLWLDGLLTRSSYRRLCRTLSAMGMLGDVDLSWSATRRRSRVAAYAAVRGAVRDDSVLWEVAAGISGEWSGSFESLLDAAAHLAPTGSRTAPVFRDPWPVPFSVPATLVRSPGGPQLSLQGLCHYRDYSPFLSVLEAVRLSTLTRVGCPRTGANVVRLPGVR